jgi:hypothetical protein
MTLEAIDYSYARPDPKLLAREGIKVVARYLFDSSKGLTDSERKALHAEGIAVVLNFEANSGDALLGASAGKSAGQNARSLAKQLGAPKGTPIYYSVDQQILSDAQMSAVLAYLEAADHSDYPSRVYGQASVVDAWYRKTKRPGWQTIAWSNGRISDHACFYQYEINQTWHGSAVDFDEIRKLDKLGAWSPEGHQPADGDELEVDGVKISKEKFDEMVNEQVKEALHAVLLGAPRTGEWTHAKHPQLVPGSADKGIYDRLHALDGKNVGGQ